MKVFDLRCMRTVAGVFLFLPMPFAGLPASAQQSAIATEPAGAMPSQDLALFPQISWQTAPRGAANPAHKAGEGQGTEAKPQKTGIEGVKVHGHWVIDVKNADGKVVAHRDFENSLTTNQNTGLSGDQILTSLLSGNAVTGGPAIVFIYGGTNPPISGEWSALCGLGTAVYTSYCAFFTAAGSQLATYSHVGTTVSTGLTAQASFGWGAVNWVLSGIFTVPTNPPSGLSSVATVLSLCAKSGAAFIGPVVWYGTSPDGTGSISPATCSGVNPAGATISYGMLTFSNIPNGPMAVTAGEVIVVKVTITFS